ncbi:MAG: hypothetical protein ACI9Y1_003273 [Lentisphaeria bacterium]|jgi:hypothetical protein
MRCDCRPFFIFTLLLSVGALAGVGTENHVGDDDADVATHSLPTVTFIKYAKSTSGREEYDVNLLRLAMEKTRAEYGDYQIEIRTFPYVAGRRSREIAVGVNINVMADPPRPDTIFQDGDTTVIPLPIMKGLLGYRALVANAKSADRIAKLNTVEEFQALSIGQGAGWIDSQVYRKAGMRVVDPSAIGRLYPMLVRGRFDAISLGISEISQTLQDAQKKVASGEFNELVIVPNIVIYYPLPVFFTVSGLEPELAARIELGLQRAKRDGSFDHLFDRHFAPIVTQFFSPTTRVLALRNPSLESFRSLLEPLPFKPRLEN